ncbi:MAG TPA: hypothetical protein VG188_06275 [Solirubrobacteraceae bacterium]|jgi:hypothetical protein|nr:hypothetical protein [Solirubrobacteraceae bacterium]
MPSGPAQPPPPERPASADSGDRASAGAGARGGVESAAEERYGPLTITRVTKDDGRSLILYGHDESQAERAGASAREPQRRAGPS